VSGEPDRPSDESLHKVFDAAWSLLLTFFDWRHRILVRFVVAESAMFGAYAATLKPDKHDRWIHTAILAVGVVIGILAALLDDVNQDMIRRSHRVGRAVETHLGLLNTAWVDDFGGLAADRLAELRKHRGAFQTLDDRGSGNEFWRSYHVPLRMLYAGSALGCLVGAFFQCWTTYGLDRSLVCVVVPTGIVGAAAIAAVRWERSPDRKEVRRQRILANELGPGIASAARSDHDQGPQSD
jgi:hypothetical protein